MRSGDVGLEALLSIVYTHTQLFATRKKSMIFDILLEY